MDQIEQAGNEVPAVPAHRAEQFVPCNIVPNYCQICDEVSDSQHFGASACRACAAFFRRTVAHRLRYVCRFESNCATSKSSRVICKSCRLAKCLRVGMDPSAVRSRQDSLDFSQQKLEPESSESAKLQFTQITPNSFSIARPVPVFPFEINETTTTKIQNLLCGKEIRIQETSSPSEEIGKSLVAVEHKQKQFDQNLTVDCQKTGPEEGMKFTNIEGNTKCKVLEEIIRLREGINVSINEKQLPKDYPILARILLGYDRLERQRDIRYNRVKNNANGTKTRIFEEKQIFDLYAYWQNLRNEIEWVADMLLYFDQYQSINMADKLCLFTNFWILFIILERNYNSFNVLADSNSEGKEDARMVFVDGEIFDMDKCKYDFSKIGNSEVEEQLKIDNNYCSFKPWFKRSVREVMPLIRRLKPHPVEISFCFGLMFWRFPVDVEQKLSCDIVTLAQHMIDRLYQELANFYANEMPSMNQVVQRVAELDRLMSRTEILALQRKEEIILARTFRAFKVDIYMEDLFGRA